MANNWNDLLQESNYKTFIVSVFCGRNDMEYLLDGGLLKFSPDYKYSVDYVVENFTDGEDKQVLQLRFGTNGYEPHSFEEVGEAMGKTPTEAFNRCTGAVCRLRKNHIATFILGHGFGVYNEYVTKKTALVNLVQSDFSLRRLIDLFEHMQVWELKFQRTRAYNSIMRELLFRQDNRNMSVLKFLLLTEKHLRTIKGLGDKGIEEILILQKGLVTKYSEYSLDEFRTAIGAY